jgi:hypothetical protein
MKTDKGKYYTRVSVRERQKRRKKCEISAIMAMALTQHERMPGHPAD